MSQGLHPEDVQVVGEVLAVRWKGGGESFVPLEALRRGCPCASCQGERDIMGRLHREAPRELGPAAFRLLRLDRVGSYALRPAWADGHATGLYSYEYLQELGRR